MQIKVVFVNLQGNTLPCKFTERIALRWWIIQVLKWFPFRTKCVAWRQQCWWFYKLV